MAIMWIETDENETLNFIQNNLEIQQLPVLSLDFLLQTNAKVAFFSLFKLIHLYWSWFVQVSFFCSRWQTCHWFKQIEFYKTICQVFALNTFTSCFMNIYCEFFLPSCRSTKKKTLIEQWSQTERKKNTLN